MLDSIDPLIAPHQPAHRVLTPATDHCLLQLTNQSQDLEITVPLAPEDRSWAVLLNAQGLTLQEKLELLIN